MYEIEKIVYRRTLDDELIGNVYFKDGNNFRIKNEEVDKYILIYAEQEGYNRIDEFVEKYVTYKDKKYVVKEKQSKKRTMREIGLLISCLAMISAGLYYYSKKNINTEKRVFYPKEVEEELLIHTGYKQNINPKSDSHGCEIVSDSSKDFKERLEITLRISGYDEEFIDAALLKYDLLNEACIWVYEYDKNIEHYNYHCKINKKIYEEAQKIDLEELYNKEKTDLKKVKEVKNIYKKQLERK